MRKRLFWIVLACLMTALLSGCGGRTESGREPIPLEQLDEEAIADTLEYVDQISTDLEPVLSAYQDENGYVAPEDRDQALEAICQYAQELYERGQITDYSYEPGDSGVCMRVDGWLTVFYDAPMEGVMTGGEDAPQIVTLEPNASETKEAYWTARFKGPKQAADQIVSQFPEFEYTHQESDGEVSVESFRRTAKNSIVLYCGHGYYSLAYGPMICAEIDQNEEEMCARYVKEFEDDALIFNPNKKGSSEGSCYLTPRFFDKYVPEDAFEGCLIYLGSCRSYSDMRLAQSLFDKGARAVIGNTDIIGCIYNYRMIYTFCKALAEKTENGDYRTLSEALHYAAQEEEDEKNENNRAEVIAAYLDDFTLPQLADAVDYGYSLACDSVLEVYGLDNEQYAGYTLHIRGQEMKAEVGPMLTSESEYVEKTIQMDEAKALDLHLEQGRYTFELTDHAHPELVERFVVTVTKDGSKKLSVETDFGDPEVTVSDIWNDSFVITEWGDEMMACYHVPRIVGDWRFDAVNADIDRELSRIMDQQVYDEEVPVWDTIKYEWYAGRDVISILVRYSDSIFNYEEYDAFNVSTRTGEYLGVDGLLALYGLDAGSAREAVRKAVTAYMDDWRGVADIGDDTVALSRQRTFSEENMEAVRFWVDPRGELCIAVGIYVPGDYGFDHYLMDLSGNAVEPDFDCGTTHIYIPAESINTNARYTVEQVEQLTAQYYNEHCVSQSNPGTYVVFSSETITEGAFCTVVVRFQGDNATAANIFVADVRVDRNTGEMFVNGELLGNLADGDTAAGQDWGVLYHDFIVKDRSNADYSEDWEYVNYYLVHMDDDGIPELWIDYSIYASGCRVVTCADGTCADLLLGSGGVTFAPKQGRFLVTGGIQGVYWDEVYGLESGQVKLIAEGSRMATTAAAVEFTYEWNGQKVSEAEYTRKAEESIGSSAETLEQQKRYSYDEMLQYLGTV